ncbi:hypothetical protein [Paludibaculum fermentans]|uniref:hypothetical protein n=1 Tax=Paludibaculum fermentans TaxID=1473598 RepID=UPI003EB9947A
MTFEERSDYATNIRLWKVERETETTQGYFYDSMENAGQPSQVALHAKGLRTAG